MLNNQCHISGLMTAPPPKIKIKKQCMNKEELLAFLCDLLPGLSIDKFMMHSTASSTTLIVLNRY